MSGSEKLVVPVSKLNPAPYNPRKDLQPGDREYDALEASIKRWHLVQRLVWNKRTGHLISGHQRLKVLVDMGVEELEVTVVDLPPEEEAALNIALNKIEGEWDFAALGDVLTGLKERGFDLDLTGFTADEVGAILEGWDPDKKASVKPSGFYSLRVEGVRAEDKALVAEAIEKGVEEADMEYEVRTV